MDVNGDFTFDAPQEITWKALQDPEVLASIMPGGEDFKEVGENEYSGMLNVKVGPVQGKFAGTIKLSDIVAPQSYNIQVDGKGGPGFVKANGGLKLSEQGDKTYMTYEGKAQVGGRIATVGQRLLEASTKSIIRQSLEGLNEYLKVQVAAGATVKAASKSTEEIPESLPPAEGSPYVPPSQTDIAKNVFRDVANDIIPAKYRVWVFGILVVVVIIIFYQILR
jgi:carbon monoxide dehydrogenase subunit G